MVRPGRDVRSEFDQVGLVPSSDLDDGRRGWMATFHRAPSHIWVYVDMTTPPVWDGDLVRAVDLDLDVIRGREGDVVVDDEDEFAEHRVELGYPPEVIALAETSRDRVRAAILDELAPYDGSHERWLRALDTLSARS
jgi:protein associated with RNAse G/E